MVNLQNLSYDVLMDCIENSHKFRDYIVRNLIIDDLKAFKDSVEVRIRNHGNNKIAAIKELRAISEYPHSLNLLMKAYPNAGFTVGASYNNNISLSDAKRFVEQYDT